MKGFILGTIVGGAAVWLYGDRLREAIDARTEAVRGRVADGIGAVSDSLDSIRERIENGLAGSSGELEHGRRDLTRPAVGIE